MAHYRIYTVSADRHIVGVVDIEAADDLEASGTTYRAVISQRAEDKGADRDHALSGWGP